MNRSNLLSAVAFPILLLIGCGCSKDTSLLVFSSYQHAIDGVPIEFVVTLTNGNSTPLTIQNVETSCSCTEAKDLNGIKLEAGEKKEARFVLENRGRVGIITESATLFLSNGKSVKIPLEANVARVLDLPSENLSLITHLGQESEVLLEAQWVVKNHRITSTRLLNFPGQTMVDVPDDQNKQRIHLQPRVHRWGEEWSGVLELQTDYPQMPMRTLAVRGMVEHRVKATPLAWVMGRINTQSPPACHTDILLEGELPFVPVQPNFKDFPCLTATFEKHDERRWNMRLELETAPFLASRPSGRTIFRQKLLVPLSLADEVPLAVSIIGAVEK